MRDKIAALSQGVKVLHDYEVEAIKEMNLLIEGKNVIIQTGKYKGRRARIRRYYTDFGNELLHVEIYRLTGSAGRRGEERFIDDHANSFIRFKDCEFV